jgi:hypothetical protein
VVRLRAGLTASTSSVPAPIHSRRPCGPSCSSCSPRPYAGPNSPPRRNPRLRRRFPKGGLTWCGPCSWHWCGAIASAQSLAGLGLPLRAHLLGLFPASAGAARRRRRVLPDPAPSGALPPWCAAAMIPCPSARQGCFPV